MRFKNRRAAGRALCTLLAQYQHKDVVVYALPRGGVPVAAEIAAFLHAPLDLIFAHKIGHPYQPEYAIAAVSENGHVIRSPHEQGYLSEAWFKSEKERQMQEIARKRQLYLKDRKDVPVEGKIAIIVDDGIATGLTMQVGIAELKGRLPAKIVAAVPIAPKSTADLLKTMADEFVGMEIEDDQFLGAVGAYYEDFDQVEDYEVINMLNTFK